MLFGMLDIERIQTCFQNIWGWYMAEKRRRKQKAQQLARKWNAESLVLIEQFNQSWCCAASQTYPFLSHLVNKEFLVRANMSDADICPEIQQNNFTVLAFYVHPLFLVIISHGDGRVTVAMPTQVLSLSLSFPGSCGKSWNAKHMEEKCSHSCCRADALHHRRCWSCFIQNLSVFKKRKCLQSYRDKTQIYTIYSKKPGVIHQLSDIF